MTTAWASLIADLRARGLHRRVNPIHSGPAGRIRRGGRTLVHLCSNNYLGLATHPAVVEAAIDSVRRYGTGAGASPLVTGFTSLHEELEADLAAFKGTPGAIVFPSGYAANLGVFSAIAGPRTHVFADALNHASLFDGARAVHAQVHVYRHADPGHLEHLLGATPRGGRRIVVTDGVFGMDGDLAPIPELLELVRRYDAILIVDDAHGTGVMGTDGRGTLSHFGIDPGDILQVGTLSKALGSQGGFVAGSAELVDVLRNRARSFVYSTGLAPAAAGAALAALRLLGHSENRRTRLRNNTGRLRAGLTRLGYRVQGHAATSILPLIVGPPTAALQLSEALDTEGILVTAIRPPTVPDGTSRLRVTTMATHTAADLEEALCAFRSVIQSPEPAA